MKRKFLFASFIASMSFMTSCEEENNDLYSTYTPSYELPTELVYTTFDQVAVKDLSIPEVSKVDIELADGTILPTTVTNNALSFSYPLAEVGLGVLDQNGKPVTEVAADFLATKSSGDVIRHNTAFYLTSPISIQIPTLQQTSAEDTLIVKVATANASVDTEEVRYKVVKKGELRAEIPFETKDFWLEDRKTFKMPLDGSTFSIADTIIVEVVTKSGELEALGGSETVVKKYGFNATAAHTFDMEAAAYSLWEGKVIKFADSVMFANPDTVIHNDLFFSEEGFETDLTGENITYNLRLPFEAKNEEGKMVVVDSTTNVISRSVDFVALNGDEDYTDMTLLKELYNNGTPVTVLSNFKLGDVAVFKIVQNEKVTFDATGEVVNKESVKWGAITISEESRPADALGNPLEGNIVTVETFSITE